MVSGTTAEPSLPCHMVIVSEMSRNGQPYTSVLIIFRVFNFHHRRKFPICGNLPCTCGLPGRSSINSPLIIFKF